MANKKTYQKQIGDGKLPNKYWVFQYDQKHQRNKNEDGSISIDLMSEDKEAKNDYLGVFNTFKEALQTVDNKAYLPNVVIEDRLSGQVFEQICIVCPCCNKEDWETHIDIKFTQEKLEELGQKFE
jgi:hypothetical protein